MDVQPEPRGGKDLSAQRVAFALVFQGRRSPAILPDHSDNEFIALIQAEVAGASEEECRQAVHRVRGLCDAVYDICERFREGEIGSGPGDTASAIKVLSDQQPGFSETEYAEAFAAGLLWTAF